MKGVAEESTEGAIAFVGRKNPSSQPMVSLPEKEGSRSELWHMLIVIVFAILIASVLWTQLAGSSKH